MKDHPAEIAPTAGFLEPFHGWNCIPIYMEKGQIEILLTEISVFWVFLRGTIDIDQSVSLHVFTWYHTEMKFISPKTESCMQIFLNKIFIVKVFICLCLTFHARKSHNLKILVLQQTGDFNPPPPPTPRGIVTVSYEGLCSPWTVPFQYFEIVHLSHAFPFIHPCKWTSVPGSPLLVRPPFCDC